MYAWRRTNVAELNHRARERWAADGHLSGPELEAPGGRRYQAGDRIVTLAPTIDQTVVNGQTGTVTAVDNERQHLHIRLDTGLTRTFTGGELDAQHLDHAYATTIHRAQGATVDTTHRYHDGGGRELAYVANSRARHHTTIHTVADTLHQAIDDLAADWAHEHRPRWALDTGTPTDALERAAVKADQAALEHHLDPLARSRDGFEPDWPHAATGQGVDAAGRPAADLELDIQTMLDVLTLRHQDAGHSHPDVDHGLDIGL